MLTNTDIIKYMDNPTNDPILIYNLRENYYEPDKYICLHILKNQYMNYLNMIIEYEISEKLEKNIIQSIELFLLNNNDITEKQYEIMGAYFESINCIEYISQITKLIMNANNKELKDFLGIWIGIDKELDKFIMNMNVKKETSSCIIS